MSNMNRRAAITALLAALAFGCAGDRLRSPAELAEAQKLARTYDVRYVEMVEAHAESKLLKVIWVHPPYATAQFDYTLPVKIPVKQTTTEPAPEDIDD